MRRIIGLAVVLGFTVNATAQAPPAKSNAAKAAKSASSPAPAAPPSVEQILERYITALGGRDAYRAVTSRVYRGTVTMKMGGDELPDGTVELLTKAPDRVRITIDVKGIVVEEGFDGTTAWEFNSIDGGVRMRRGARAEKARLDAQFYEDLQFAEMFKEIDFGGTGTVRGQKTFRLQAVSSEGLRRTYHFSVASGLMVRIDDEVNDHGRVDRFVTDLQGYRAVGGVKVPTTVRLTSPDMDMTITFTEVRQNVPIDEARFKRPKAEPR